MSRYKLVILPSVVKELERLPSSVRASIIEKSYQLADNPKPQGSIKLKGREAYRIRVGNYRVIYTIKDKELIVTVINAGHRKDIYR